MTPHVPFYGLVLALAILGSLPDCHATGLEVGIAAAGTAVAAFFAAKTAAGVAAAIGLSVAASAAVVATAAMAGGGYDALNQASTTPSFTLKDRNGIAWHFEFVTWLRTKGMALRCRGKGRHFFKRFDRTRAGVPTSVRMVAAKDGGPAVLFSLPLLAVAQAYVNSGRAVEEYVAASVEDGKWEYFPAKINFKAADRGGTRLTANDGNLAMLTKMTVLIR